MDAERASEIDLSKTDQERLWAPWRMAYVGKRAPAPNCIFCERLAAGNDTASLILHRGRHSFVIMNLFPYNTGHVMIVPVAHGPDVGQLDEATLTEMAVTLPRITRSSQRALACHGFNVGLNLGAVAGAGIADHLHQHVVPRWTGDANFMPIVASTTVMPEMIPVTYAKLRVEMAREMAASDGDDGPPALRNIVWSPSRGEILVARRDGAWHLPRVPDQPDEPRWRTATAALDRDQGRLDLIGLAAGPRADPDSPLALIFQARLGYDPGVNTLMDRDRAIQNIPEDERSLIPMPLD